MRSPDAEPGQKPTRRNLFLAVLLFATGFLSLALEVVYIRILSLVLGNTSYAISVILSSFLLGLALGNLLYARHVRRHPPARTGSMAGLLILTAILNIGAYYLSFLVPLLYFLIHRLPGAELFLFFIIQVIPCFLVVLPPAAGMGAIYAACFIRLEETGETGVEAYSQLFFVSTLGSIAGSLAAGFLMIPLLGLKLSVFLSSLAYILLALGGFSFRDQGLFKRVALLLLLLLLGQAGMEPERPGEQFNFYMLSRCWTFADLKSKLGNTRTLFHREDVEGTVMVLQDQFNGARYLSVAGKVEGSSSMDMPNQALLAVLPAAFTTGRTRALNIGLGTGSTLHFLADLEPGFAEIDSVELNRSVLEATTRFFHPDLLGKPRIHHFINDARRFMLATTRHYDLITSEPSYPTDSGVSFLFTDEFFALVKERLTRDGVFCQWLPAYLLDPATRTMFEDTLCHNFPAVYRFSVVCSSDDLFICLNTDRQADGEMIRRQLMTPRGFPQPIVLKEQLAFCGRLQPSGEQIYNTDDLPRLEFASVRNILTRVNQGRKRGGG